MCRYCDFDKYESEYDRNMSQGSDVLYIDYLYDGTYDITFEEVSMGWTVSTLPINYCPMCGRRLNNGKEI